MVANIRCRQSAMSGIVGFCPYLSGNVGLCPAKPPNGLALFRWQIYHICTAVVKSFGDYFQESSSLFRWQKYNIENAKSSLWMIIFRNICSAQNLKKNFLKLLMFSDFFFKFSHFSPSQNKNSPSRFYFLLRKIFSTSENSCHSLHEYCNLLIFKPSPCNDKQKCHVTDVTFAIEWHQWHAKNKHIARGGVDIQRFMTSVQWVQWDWESKLIYLHSTFASK